MFREKISQFLLGHKIVLLPLLLLVIGLLITNFFVDKHIAYLTGEQVFSFDYTGHVRNIIYDFSDNRSTLLQTNDCLGCPDFYHYSRWYSFVNLSIFSIGSLLHIHPFLFYIFLTIGIQFVAVYISFRLLFKEVQWLAFFIASSVFIILPVNFTYLGSGLYSFNHAFLLLSLSLAIRALKNIEILSFKKVIQWGAVTGIASSVFFNVSIGFLPIFLYSFIGTLICFYNKWISSWKKIICFSITVMSLMVILNISIVVSALLHGNSRDFFTYNKVSLLDSFTAGVTMVPVHLQSILPIFVVIFFFVVVVLLIKSNLSRKQVLLGASFYFFVVILLSGDIVYDFVFHYFPLMGSLRSLHRLIVFEEIALLFVVYKGLSTLLHTGRLRDKYLTVLFSFILIGIPCTFIKDNWAYLNKMSVPDEYFQADAYLSQNSDKKIYFPAYLPWGQTINGNYDWSKNNAPQATLYQNPFTSIFAVPNLITLERYPFVTQRQMEMRALFDYANDPEKIVKAMRDMNIKYIIFDRNFLWQKNFPTFDYDKLISHLDLTQSFGNIDVYQVKSSTKKCKKSYGEYTYGYCHVEQGERPDYLLSTSKEDYFIETYKPQNNDLLPLLVSDYMYRSISDPSLQDYLINKKVAFADVMTIDNNFSNKLQVNTDAIIFRKNIGVGQYRLVIPLMEVTEDQIFFKESRLRVFVNNKKVATLRPQGTRNGLVYEMIPLDLKKEASISLQIEGNGYLVVKNPYILEQEKYNSIIKDEEWQPDVIYDPL